MTQLVLPIDVAGRAQIDELVGRTKGLVDFYKFGSIPFTLVGPDLVKLGHDAGTKVFLDLKYHDIPNTVAGAAQACVSETRLPAMRRCNLNCFMLARRPRSQRRDLFDFPAYISFA